MTQNKRKIINDPVHGFITIPSELVYDIIEHPWFQRLRHIRQLGLTYMVYPGAVHSRFQHSLGAMHLMNEAIELLKIKNIDISAHETQSLLLAILLHDIGHSPFSHTLENILVENLNHEKLSLIFMEHLNRQFDNSLTQAIEIYTGTFSKKYFHHLVAGQLDMDRLDYLMRDSFFTGVAEGVINTERIIKMLNVAGDELVVDAKGIYSIEKFIVARRLMYWQVYLHKTVLAAEHLLINILKRAKFLAENGEQIFASPALETFLKGKFTEKDFRNHIELLETFARLDDHEILFSVKMWAEEKDKILSLLSKRLIHRKLFKIEISDKPFETHRIGVFRKKIADMLKINFDDACYFVFSDEVFNNAYNPYFDKIRILYKDNTVLDITESSDQINAAVLSKTQRKYFLCYPKELSVTGL